MGSGSYKDVAAFMQQIFSSYKDLEDGAKQHVNGSSLRVAQMSRPEYCVLESRHFQKQAKILMAPDGGTMAKYWCSMPKIFQERLLVTVYLTTNNPTLGAAMGILRSLFIEESDDVKIANQFGRLLSVREKGANGGRSWVDDTGLLTTFLPKYLSNECFLPTFTEVETVVPICNEFLQRILENIIYQIGTVDEQRLYRKMRACRINFTKDDRKRVRKWIGCSPTDTYAVLLRSSYSQEALESLLFGRLLKCATCGVDNRQKQLFCCETCSKERVRHKARYCSEACQRKQWKQHQIQHHSSQS